MRNDDRTADTSLVSSIPPEKANVSWPARFYGFLEFALFLGSLTVMLWQLQEWLFFPPEEDFPYLVYVPLLLLSSLIQISLWRRIQKPRHRSRATPVPSPNPAIRRRLLLCGGIAFATLCLVATVFYLDASQQVRKVVTNGIPVASISAPFLDATVAMEDGHFYQHHGIDGAAIHRAFRINLRERRIKQGGSTITQQLAKNLFLTKDRTFQRKLQELFFTVALENTLTKQQILHLYTQSIDYGMGQKGITAAAQYYFHKNPGQITLAESAFLVGLVPRPPKTWLSEEQLEAGRNTALDRVAYFFPNRYPPEAIAEARSLPLEAVVFPYLSPQQRGATATIPEQICGVSLYSFAYPETPLPIERVNPHLIKCLRDFLTEAQAKFGVVGLDHLGLYVDRPVRGETYIPSAHAFGQAFDIAGFRLRDGSRLVVKEHADPLQQRRLLELRQLLEKHFKRVLHWENEPKRHSDHFHAEVIEPRPLSHPL